MTHIDMAARRVNVDSVKVGQVLRGRERVTLADGSVFAVPHPKPNPPAEAFEANLRRCDDPACGLPRSSGRPPRGWVKAGTPSNAHGERWWCSWHCLSRGALVLALRGES